MMTRSALIVLRPIPNLIFLRSLRVRLKSMFFIITLLMASTLITFTFVGNFFEFGKKYNGGPVRAKTNRNYFLSQGSTDNLEFMVNTSGCKILDLDPWDSSIIEHIVKLDTSDVCDTNMPHWTYVNGSTVVINQTAIQESGYPFGNMHCCYKTIHRVVQDINKYDDDADTVVRYSEDCIKMGLITTPSAEHIRVICQVQYLHDEVFPVVYKNFHAVALTTPKRVQKVIKRWKLIEEDEEAERKLSSSQVPSDKDKPGPPVERPPNVIMVGMDSTSRLNFRRAMFKTKEILEQIGAHEMVGYTKVGENTYPNTIPFLTGYHEYQMEDLCRYKKETKLDDCPFIWKTFKDAHYLTAEVEDSPRLTSFNFLKTGFVLQPTDFYSRPIMLASYQDVPGYPYSLDCLGYKTVDQFQLEYMRDLIQLAKSENVPLFLMSWLTQLGHDGFNNIQTGDRYYAAFLQSLVSGNLLNNSVLFFMSDHGYRFGAVRNTLSGWYEDRLPLMYIWLSPNIREKYPEWEQALSLNERQLSSPYDLYHTFVQILQTFSHMPDIQESPMRNGTTLPRIYGQSFFKPFAEDRTCDSVGVPDYYCACQFPVKISLEDPVVKQAAGAAIKKINKSLPSVCLQFALSQIVGGALMSSSNENDALAESSKSRQYVIDFETKPGDFLFEATVQYSKNKSSGQEQFEVSGVVQRLSKINTDVSCVHDATMQLYCYCESLLEEN